MWKASSSQQVEFEVKDLVMHREYLGCRFRKDKDNWSMLLT